MLKPDVVFFGEFVPAERFAEARSLVVGGRRAARRRVVARRQLRHPPARARPRAASCPSSIVNRGVTKGDSRAAVKLDAGTSETLAALAERLVPASPLATAPRAGGPA